MLVSGLQAKWGREGGGEGGYNVYIATGGGKKNQQKTKKKKRTRTEQFGEKTAIIFRGKDGGRGLSIIVDKIF